MKELKELINFLLGFMPWLLFLFFSGRTFASLERSIILGLLASLIFGFKELRRGFLLQWGTLIFFIFCVIAVDLIKSVWVAKSMGIISNGCLAGLIWGTIFVGKPFTLQYARAELPKERWDDPVLFRSCRFMAVVWAILLTFLTLVACLRNLYPGIIPDWLNLGISITVIAGGIAFTSLYKKYKRNQSNS